MFWMSVILWTVTTVLSGVGVVTLFIKNGDPPKKAFFEIGTAILLGFITYNLEPVYDSIADFILPNETTTSTQESVGTTYDGMTDYNQTDTVETDHQHKVFATEVENIIEPSCVEDGSYDSVEYCDCGQELYRDNIISPALGHNYKSNRTMPSCNQQGFTTYTCSLCKDSYVDNYTDELGHNFMDGLCTRCGISDPDYVKVYTSEEIMCYLSTSIVASSGTYNDYLGSERISVFAEDRNNCFSINTAVSYNMWGGNVQSVIFNVSNLTDLDILTFDIGGETGSSGSMTVEIFLNKTLEESADYIYDIEASAIPTHVSINFSDVISFGIRVTNHSGNQNRLVFFNFSDGNS